MIDKLKKWATSKTVWGTIILSVSFVPQLAPYEPILRPIGTALAGVGVADKLDRIREAANPNRPRSSY